VESVITEEMRSILGVSSGGMISYPVSASDIRRWAIAVYYPEPLHIQPCFSHLGYRAGQFPHAERACAESLALPIYPELSEAAQDRVCEVVRSFFA